MLLQLKTLFISCSVLVEAKELSNRLRRLLRHDLTETAQKISETLSCQRRSDHAPAALYKRARDCPSQASSEGCDPWDPDHGNPACITTAARAHRICTSASSGSGLARHDGSLRDFLPCSIRIQVASRVTSRSKGTNLRKALMALRASQWLCSVHRAHHWHPSRPLRSQQKTILGRGTSQPLPLCPESLKHTEKGQQPR